MSDAPPQSIEEWYIVLSLFRRYECRVCHARIRTTHGMAPLYNHLWSKHRREFEEHCEREYLLQERLKASGATA